MTRKATGTHTEQIAPAAVDSSIVDDLVDRYLGWREECVALWDAYDRWRTAADEDRRLAYVAYLAGLDREQQAARCYQHLAESVDAETHPR